MSNPSTGKTTNISIDWVTVNNARERARGKKHLEEVVGRMIKDYQEQAEIANTEQIVENERYKAFVAADISAYTLDVFARRGIWLPKVSENLTRGA